MGGCGGVLGGQWGPSAFGGAVVRWGGPWRRVRVKCALRMSADGRPMAGLLSSRDFGDFR